LCDEVGAEDGHGETDSRSDPMNTRACGPCYRRISRWYLHKSFDYALTIEKESSRNERARKHAWDQVILKLAKCAIHEARKNSIFQVQYMDCESEEASWCNAQEDQASALSCEAVVHRIHKG
jgi:hypothetical protein